jgi:molybdopterin molybdotransferase
MAGKRTARLMSNAHEPLPPGLDPCDLPGHGHAALTLDEARAQIIASVQPITDHESVAIAGALGRVLARPVQSTIDVPADRNSAMDGYALAAADLPAQGSASYVIAGVSWAGRPYAGRVTHGECVRIMTGAVLPEGTDTVVMQEHVRLQDGCACIEAGHRPGQHVRPRGEDIGRGQVVLEAGTGLRPAHLGLLASLGIEHVAVLRRPRVAIFSTGDELRPPGAALGVGQIYDSNRHTLHGMLQRLGMEVLDLGIVPDTREDTLRAFESAAGSADAIISSGGVSVGEADYVTETLQRHGRIGFWKVAMKPGKPIAFGHFGRACFFGLPGNPVSVMVTFYQIVRPALVALSGARDADPPVLVRAVCTTRLRKKPGRLEFQRGVLERTPSGAYTVRSTGHQGAGVLRSMAEANCFIIVALEHGDVEPGSEVDVQPFAGLA